MHKNLFELTKSLSDIVSPVGQEQAICDHMAQLWEARGLKVKRTQIGNVLARGKPVSKKKTRKKLLVAAHGDELCYMVRAIDANGFLFLANGQGWSRTTDLRNAFTIGSRVTVLARGGPLPGVIAAATGHVATLALPDLKELTWRDLWVDTGLSREQLIVAGVTPGTRIVWDAKTERWGDDKIVGKALDDRAALAVMTAAIDALKPADYAWDVTWACTVQEEIGTIGAYALAAQERFDAAIIVEIGMAGDIPAVSVNDMPLVLGAGPGLIHKDSLIHYDHALTASLERCAADHKIPIQHAVFGSFGSDGRAFTQADVPTAMMVFPARYTHSPFEMASLRDLSAMVDWLCAFIGEAD
jgi:putative aminopeptidase FrvX